MARDTTQAKPMSADELRRHCSRLYGAHRWQTALAHELQVNDRTVRRWASGASPVPQSAAMCVRLMVFLDELSWLGEWRKLLDEEEF
jgi:hypothetical protein